MNKCFSNGTVSQQQFCNDEKAEFVYYNAPTCDPAHVLSLAYYPIDECVEPDVSNLTTADLALLPKASHRIMNCNSTEGLPADDAVAHLYRSEERRVGKEVVSPC